MTDIAQLRRRPRLDRDRPNRTAGTLYRASQDDPDAIGGVPLNTVESAATAAVRLGYKIAAAQVDRSARIAKRFRDAGDRAAGMRRERGESSEAMALDATEQLIFRTLMAGLGWFEGIAADNGNPVRRIAAAQFQLLGKMLGLLPVGPAPASAPGPPPTDSDLRARPRPHVRPLPTIKHANGTQTRRAVRIQNWELSSGARNRYPVTFYSDAGDATVIRGQVNVNQSGAAVLTIDTPAAAAGGHYKAAICDDAGLQIGYVEIVL